MLLGLVISIYSLSSLAQAAPADKVPIQSAEKLWKGPEGEVSLGGLSDLVCATSESTKTKKVFYTLTDRGPNGKTKGGKKNPQRPFLFPDFTPQILKLEWSKEKGAQVVQKILLKSPEGESLTGLPNVLGDETPIDRNDKRLSAKPWGLDSEGLAVDDQKNFWVSEEYGPSLLKVNPQGQVIKKWIPFGSSPERAGLAELPKFLKERKYNRGFEALVWTPQKTVLMFLQSEVPKVTKTYAPIVEFDPKTEKTIGVYLYPLSDEGGKIGAATVGSAGDIWILEQNGEVGKKAWQRVFAVKMPKEANLFNEAILKQDLKLTGKEVLLQKKEVLNLTESGLQDFEKLEGLCRDNEGSVYVVNDNDFSVHKENEKTDSYLLIMKEPK